MKKWKYFQISTCLQTLFEARCFHNMSLVGINTKSILTSAIYQKCLTMASAGMKSDSSTGQLVNLMSVDTQKIVDVLVSCFTIKVQLLTSSYLLRKSLIFKYRKKLCFGVDLSMNRYLRQLSWDNWKIIAMIKKHITNFFFQKKICLCFRDF